MSVSAMPLSRHVRSLAHAELAHASALGEVRRLDGTAFPLLQGLSIKRLRLEADAMREAHWHANADELAYVCQGQVRVQVIDNGDQVSAFVVSEGQMFHIPSGALHLIENLGPGRAELIIAFSHAHPQDFSLQAAFGAMSDAVLGNTFDLPASAFAALPRDTGSRYLVPRPRGLPPASPDHAQPLRFDVEAQSAPVTFPYGHARVARSQFWPALRHLAMYSLQIGEDGMREPHWHPDTAEMGYVHRGHARMTVLDPDGSTDTYLLSPGDVYFIPPAYPHQIEALGQDIHFLVFFDRPMPADIGYRLCGAALPPATLAATFGVPVERMPVLPATARDPLIVARGNPLDPCT